MLSKFVCIYVLDIWSSDDDMQPMIPPQPYENPVSDTKNILDFILQSMVTQVSQTVLMPIF